MLFRTAAALRLRFPRGTRGDMLVTGWEGVTKSERINNEGSGKTRRKAEDEDGLTGEKPVN